MTDTSTLDDKVVQLRSQGKSFGSIASLLGYERAPEATAAFNRGIRRRPEPERTMLREQELTRLDLLVRQLRAGSRTVDSAELEVQLRTVDRLRQMLLED